MCVCFLKVRLQCKNLYASGSNYKSVHHKNVFENGSILAHSYKTDSAHSLLQNVCSKTYMTICLTRWESVSPTK